MAFMGRQPPYLPTCKACEMQRRRLTRMLLFGFGLVGDRGEDAVPPLFGCAALSTPVEAVSGSGPGDSGGRSTGTQTSISRVLRSCPASVNWPEWM